MFPRAVKTESCAIISHKMIFLRCHSQSFYEFFSAAIYCE